MSKKDPKRDKTQDPNHTQEILDETLEESFPASDPPGSMSTTEDEDALRKKRRDQTSR